MKKNLTFTVIFTLFIILIFLNKSVVTKSSLDAINLFQNKVFPTLFIMFIFQDLIINFSGAEFINLFLNNLFSKIFKISKAGQMVFTLSLFSGSPSNAFILNELVLNKKINVKEANHLLSFTYFANPLFILTMLSLIFDETIPKKIMFSLYLSNFILGFITRKKDFEENYVTSKNSPNFGNILTNAIKKSMNTLIIILGSISFFMILSNIISIYIKFDLINLLTSGIFEISAGLNNLIDFNITEFFKKIIATTFISFGGLSIHLQVCSVIAESKLSYKSFLVGRLKATLIAVLIIVII